MKLLLLLAAAAPTAAAPVGPQPLALVTCPIMRDTATVPCWLAEYKGELYYLGAQGDGSGVSPPALGHQALIEGTPTEARRCGGKVLTDLHVSVLPERSPGCDAIVPASDAVPPPELPTAAAPAATAAAGSTPAVAAPPVHGSQRFEVLYDFDWQTAGRNTRVIQEAAAYAKANPQAELHIVGYRAAVRLADRSVLSEEETIGLRRARDLVATLETLGVKKDNKMFVVDEPAPELGDYTRRRAVIEVTMSGSDEHSEH